MKYTEFRKRIWNFYVKHGRHDLPWRKHITPYRIVVSEIMLQQTQVDRVIPYFTQWMRSFPSWKALARARQSDVLRHWKGLGYNSRALRLHALSQIITDTHKGRLPHTKQALEALPGIGPYTASAIRIFAFGEKDICIETNIRRIFIHHFFNTDDPVHDKDIFPLIEETLPRKIPRICSDADLHAPLFAMWYWALMDYGSHLPKKVKSNPNTQSKHYAKQSKFKGSDREIRGKILEILLERKIITIRKLYAFLGKEKQRYKKILYDLYQEGFIEIRKQMIYLK